MYRTCRNCTHHGKNCLLYVMSLSTPEMLAWCKNMKKVLHLTNAQIAEKSNTPKGTVDRLFAVDSDYTDVRFSTIRPIIVVLSGCTSVDLTCEAVPDDEQTAEKIKRLEEENANLHSYMLTAENEHRHDLEANRTDHQTEVDYLKNQLMYRGKIIKTLSIALSITLILIIIALIVDILNHDIGFFWFDSMLDSIFTERSVII